MWSLGNDGRHKSIWGKLFKRSSRAGEDKPEVEESE
jgi:hypothetical protein